MSKDYLVLRGDEVYYQPGHYDIEGARAVAHRLRDQYPGELIRIVWIQETYVGQGKRPWRDAPHNSDCRPKGD